jgi:hypothetical protein
MYLDYIRLNNSLEILPKAEDGSYYYEHLKTFAELKRMLDQIHDLEKKGIEDDDDDEGEEGKYNEKEQEPLVYPDSEINQYAIDPKTNKPDYSQPTARMTDHTSLKKPAYSIPFTHKKIEKSKRIQHSNELTLDELKNIAKKLKENPRTYKPPTKRQGKDKRARREL